MESRAADQGPGYIEQFLRTATQQDINLLKSSMSNFAGFGKGAPAGGQFIKKEDDDYIEEEFEEVIDSDEGSSNEEEDEKERLMEEMRKAQKQA